MDLLHFEALLAAEGFTTVTTVTQPAGYAMAEHAHPFDACALILRGDFTIDAGGQSARYSPGDIFRLPAGTLHSESSLQGVQYRAGRRHKE